MKLRSAVTALANDPLFADLQPPHLRRADTSLGDAVAYLEGADQTAAVAAEEKALDLLREERTRLDEQVAQTKQTIADAEFRRREEDQAKNRGAAERLDQASARLGEVGVALRKDLIRAGASMRTAEGHLGKTAAKPAADDQSAALEALVKSRDDFARSIERLLVELRTELQTRLITELTEMHEAQMSIRETTQGQAPRVLQKSRTALIIVAGLSKKEAELGDRTDHLLALIEETEFGIALPTTLRILSREMRTVVGWLAAGDVAPRTVALETRIEEDLLGLIQAIRRLPPTTPPAPGTPLASDAQGTRARAEPPDRRGQDDPDAPGAAQRRHGWGRQVPPRRRRLCLPPSGARSRPWKPRKKRFATRSRRSPSGWSFPKATSESKTPFAWTTTRLGLARRCRVILAVAEIWVACGVRERAGSR